jgi:hypothetical protein
MKLLKKKYKTKQKKLWKKYEGKKKSFILLFVFVFVFSCLWGSKQAFGIRFEGEWLPTPVCAVKMKQTIKPLFIIEKHK